MEFRDHAQISLPDSVCMGSFFILRGECEGWGLGSLSVVVLDAGAYATRLEANRSFESTRAKLLYIASRTVHLFWVLNTGKERVYSSHPS